MGPVEAAICSRYREARNNLWPVEPPRIAPPAPEPEPVRPEPEPIAEVPEGPTIADVIACVAKRRRIGRQEIRGPSRLPNHCRARQEVMWLARRLPCQPSLPQIGRALGGRDHTTILHGIRAHQARLEGREYRRGEKWVERDSPGSLARNGRVGSSA